MCIAALLTIFCVWAYAEDYKLKVGGKTVSSSNASNVTGDNIKPYLSSVNNGKASVTYDASTKTLTLYNVKIDRTGKDNRAILNDGVDGLTVILKGRNYLKAADSSPLRFNATTYLKCEMANNSNFSEIIGGSEDAITVGNDALLKIQDANLEITSNSSAFEGASDHPSLEIWDSNVKATCEAYKKDDCYAVNNFSLMKITDSDVKLAGFSQAVYNLVTLERYGSYIKSPASASFDASKKTFTLNSGGTVKEVVFAKFPKINSENFPDAVFRKYVIDHFDNAETDGYLDPSSEGYVVEGMGVNGLGISNLKGIEFFPNLKNLDCSNNNITHLNLSQNTKLTKINCQNNQLVQLVVTGCTELTSLDCSQNQLPSLEVSNQTKLQTLNCSNNKLTTLNLENNTKLKLVLDCSDNLLTSLKMKNCSNLSVLNVFNNKFKGDNIGDFITNLPSVTVGELMFCKDFNSSTDNAMTLAQAKSIKKDKGWTVKMPAKTGDTWIDYPGSDAIVINTANFPDGYFGLYVLLKLDTNKDDYLDIEERTAVKALNLDGKGISSLQGIELFTNLTKLECNNNNLQTLNVRYNKVLKELHCSQNKLTGLNVANNTNLEVLYCNGNKLTSLTVTNNTKLATLGIEGNSIKGTAMDNLISSLPDRTSSTNGVLHVFNGENSTDNEMTWAQVDAAAKRGWQAMYWVGDGWVSYPGSDAIEINETNFPDEKFRAYVAQESIDANQDGFLNPQEIADVKLIDVSYSGISDLTGIGIFTALTDLDCSGNNLTSLDVSNCKALTYLNCGGNSLTSLDVSQNTALMTLSCGGNSLTSLDVSNCKALTYLYCGGNSLTSLDVSNCTALTELSCGGNSLTSLDVSNCKALTYLYCSDNSLTSLDVSNCTALTELSCSGNSLTSLDVSNNTALTDLYCYGNAIRGAGMTTLVNSLPETEDPRRLYVYDNETPAGNWITFKQVEKAEKKGWIVSEWDGSWVPYAGEKDGDVDGDGKVNEADVQAIEDYIMGRAPEGTDIRLYDVNEDGIVDAADIVCIINAMP